MTRRSRPASWRVASSFVAVHLAKEGHSGLVGLNLLEKIQTPTLLALYGAMLAGVNVVLMGAGIPRQIPKILDDFAAGNPAAMKLDVAGARSRFTFMWIQRISARPRAQAAVVSRDCFFAGSC